MKLKTSKSAIKRIRNITRKGKILRLGMSAQHRAKGKSRRTKQQAMVSLPISSANLKTIKKLIPYR